MDRTAEVIFSWPISSFFGWGLRGLGYALNFPGTAVSASPEFDGQLPPGDHRAALLAERHRQSVNVQQQIIMPANGDVILDAPVLVPLGNDLTRGPVTGGRMLRGKPTIACPVFEDVESVERNAGRLLDYDAVVVASRWNQEVLDGLNIKSHLCHEGVDRSIFNPSVRRKRDDGRFRVFSGGKAEHRKGQDLVIEAFRIFAETHDDAVLVAAWGSPWSQAALDFEGKWEFGAPPGIHIGMPNYPAWAQRAGIKPHQFEFVTVRPNWQMAEVYGGCDVAVFPNRREGGTNFVAMECMACGVPTIRSGWHGHADLLDEPGMMTGGYDADDITKIVEWLQYVYHHGSDYEPLSNYWTWERHCADVAKVIVDA